MEELQDNSQRIICSCCGQDVTDTECDCAHQLCEKCSDKQQESWLSKAFKWYFCASFEGDEQLPEDYF